ncbi:MAG TPA: glycyl-radical enzyme activating protein, partial [Bacteroidales bacterium]|nr:glycyl-radical enzyme activating protein [Bacteroidales bacterium]
MKGLIFSIKRYAIHDGPGIRVTFFMKGCPLDCWWCHNPEGKSADQTSVERIERVGEKEFTSVELVGREYTPDELIKKADKDRIFMEQSGGGVTFSGGEPLMQFDFLLETLQAMKRAGFQTAVDTSGHTSPERLRAILPYTDLFLYDIKHLDPQKHMKFTGVSNDLILSNFDMLLNEGAEMMIRVPVIPGVTADKEYMELLRSFIENRKTKKITEINLLPYHKTGSSKYRRFYLPDRMTGVSQISNSHLDDYVE